MHFYCKFNISPYPGQCHNPKEGTLERIELKEGVEIIPFVSIIETPGHSPDMLGLVIETDKGKIVISGDAISSESQTNLSTRPADILLFNPDLYDISRKKILKLADYIIPGHDKMFKNKSN